ncbi:MAG: nucleotidyltransferase domain-containing protein [Ignavibacteriota bacterium]|jgi:predicted nucleotidyltransferase|nr:MAG: nucleotidyltransferase domain-containing protein [Chlorobiota bacterium]MBE7477374.1 nucleotidyltransferase domain-containing protein [Ignavibacteriales bacterium]MBL1122775.1 nucleotidyltransferase domain-containing protein [Ignavibacteriota bacterium]MCC7094244.1 nucleotidyltransferase domain-containing protein [Ignavibacteriaceae bacterium]MCE7855795.1 nucleotidyltransferase domain-containing protein [Ignavibacteria bacterium CHB3]
MIKVNKEKIAELLIRNKNISFAYLFGSYAKNKIRFGSDLDIGIYFNAEPTIFEIGILVNELEDITEHEIDLVSLKNLYEINPKLAYSVVADGILLFSIDEQLLVQYKKNVFLKYLDFKPVIDLFTRKLNERISNNKFADF